MFGDSGKKDRETYHENILHTIIEAGQADVFILSLCDTIKDLLLTSSTLSATFSTEVQDLTLCLTTL